MPYGHPRKALELAAFLPCIEGGDNHRPIEIHSVLSGRE